MGWRQALRQLEAHRRAEERADRRQIKEHARMIKEIKKMAAREQAAFEVEAYEKRLKQISSVHRECSDKIDWRNILQLHSPIRPQKRDKCEAAALLREKEYSPSILDWLFRRTEFKRRKLKEEIIKAKSLDEEEFQKQIQLYNLSYSDWQDLNDLAKRIVAGNTAYFGKAFRELCSFQELDELGSKINVTFNISDQCDVTFNINSDEAIPREIKTLSKNGELLIKRTPVIQFNELYQDLVIGSVLRIAREIFAALPVKIVCITVYSNRLDSSTGYVTSQPIFCAKIPQSTLITFKFDTLDPSESLRHFNHQMAFNKTKGFATINPILPT